MACECGAICRTVITDPERTSFLLTRLLIDQLLDQTTIRQMRRALDTLPSHLSEAYESSLKRIDAQSPSRKALAYRVIGWITQAQRQLTIAGLIHAIAVEEGCEEVAAAAVADRSLKSTV